MSTDRAKARMGRRSGALLRLARFASARIRRSDLRKVERGEAQSRRAKGHRPSWRRRGGRFLRMSLSDVLLCRCVMVL